MYNEMTLEQLKAILDRSGTIQSGDVIIEGTPEAYWISYDGHTRQILEQDLLPFLNDGEGWQEVKAEPTIPNQFVRSSSDKPFAPKMIVVDVREWDALQKELEILREERRQWMDYAHKALDPTHYKLYQPESMPTKSIVDELREIIGSTFDAPTEYKSDWKSIVDSGKHICDNEDNEISAEVFGNGYYYNASWGDWDTMEGFMNRSEGWKIKDQ
jgi:hypothetical protein